jgi:hypothetical protein
VGGPARGLNPFKNPIANDLYNELTELLGPRRAETLMAALPAYDISELVTKDELRAGMAELRAEFKSDRQVGLGSVNARIDRLFLATISGFIVTLGTMVGFFLAN